MSLLLDALKKAADEKNKAADKVNSKQANHTESEPDDDFSLSLDDEALPTIEPQGESITRYQEKDQTDDWLVDKAEDQRGERRDRQEDYERLSEVVSTNANKEMDSSIQPDQVVRAPDRAGGHFDYNVSDEALNLLIHKTNQSYRKNKIIWVVLVSVLSLTVLIAGGLYLTDEMQSDVAFLETRHQQSMRLIREKTSKESLPDKSVIIENLVGDENLAQKVEFEKTELAKKNQRVRNASQKKINQKQNVEENRSNVSSAQAYARKSVLSIEKSQQADPVSLLLDEAWLAYEAGDFKRSDNAYEEVLRKETNNRDALLGRGAIALENKFYRQAKSFYLALLEINPRDPDAIAALTSLAQQSNEASGKVGLREEKQDAIANVQVAKSEKYLKNLLQENEQSAVLNFSLGSVYAQQNRWKLAQEYFFKAWVKDNKNPGYAYNLAVSLDQMGKAKEAKQLYQACLQISRNKKVQFSKQSVLDRIVQIN